MTKGDRNWIVFAVAVPLVCALLNACNLTMNVNTAGGRTNNTVIEGGTRTEARSSLQAPSETDITDSIKTRLPVPSLDNVSAVDSGGLDILDERVQALERDRHWHAPPAEDPDDGGDEDRPDGSGLLHDDGKGNDDVTPLPEIFVVDGNGDEIAMRHSGRSNGNRPTYRAGKLGSAYKGPVQFELHGETYTVPNPGNRSEWPGRNGNTIWKPKSHDGTHAVILDGNEVYPPTGGGVAPEPDGGGGGGGGGDDSEPTTEDVSRFVFDGRRMTVPAAWNVRRAVAWPDSLNNKGRDVAFKNGVVDLGGISDDTVVVQLFRAGNDQVIYEPRVRNGRAANAMPVVIYGARFPGDTHPQDRYRLTSKKPPGQQSKWMLAGDSAATEPEGLTVSGDMLAFQGEPVSLAVYTCWPLANRTSNEIRLVLDEVRDMGFNGIAVRTSFLGNRNNNFTAFMREATARDLVVIAGFGIYEFPVKAWDRPRLKEGYKNSDAYSRAQSFARKYGSFPNIVFMADALDTNLDGRKRVARDLLRGFRDGAPDRLAFVMPRHNTAETELGEASFPALHSGHSDGRRVSHIKKLYAEARENWGGPVLNMESLYGGSPLGRRVTVAMVKAAAQVDAKYGVAVTSGESQVVVCEGDWLRKINNEYARTTIAIAKTMKGYRQIRFSTS